MHLLYTLQTFTLHVNHKGCAHSDFVFVLQVRELAFLVVGVIKGVCLAGTKIAERSTGILGKRNLDQLLNCLLHVFRRTTCVSAVGL